MTTTHPEPTEREVNFPDDDGKDRYKIGDLSKEASTTVNFKDLPLIDLLSENSPFTTKLCLMLNRKNNRVICNWEHLAYEMDIPRDVSSSFHCDSEHSPTDDLFDYLISWNPQMNFSQLKVKLKDAGRNDLILILNKGGYNEGWKIADNMEFVDSFKDKLDIPKRHMDWRALASKWKIPRKEMEKFGKPKLGPTEHLFTHTRMSKDFTYLTVGELKKHLSEMERFDALKIFDNHKIKDIEHTKEVLKSQSPILDELSKLLDKEGPMKNWRNLAYMLKIPETVYQDFDTSRGNNSNPTTLLLQWINANRPDFTVGMLVKCLQNINRNDVVYELFNEVRKGIEEKKFIIQKQGSIHVVVKKDSQSLSSSGQDSGSNQLLAQNTDHLSCEERKKLLVTDLPNSLYKRICNMLDAEHSFFKDYRMLGEELGMEKIDIESLTQKGLSPTHRLLLDYKIKVEEFLNILKMIDRLDVASEIEGFLENSPIQ